MAGGMRLAPGVRIGKVEERHATLVLLCPDGEVHINKGAVRILRLCDGTRDRTAVVEETVRRSRKRAHAADIGEFLDVALARGWIVEVGEQVDS